jgi:hypothetical protein
MHTMAYNNVYICVSGKPEQPTIMSILNNRYRLSRLLFIIATIYIVSCGSSSKKVYETKELDSKVRFFVTENPNYRKGEGKFYSRVDSGNVRIFYSFQPGNIFKTYNNQDNYIYTLVSNKPMLYLTNIDSVVFAKSDSLMNSFGYRDLKRPYGAVGFVIEIAIH